MSPDVITPHCFFKAKPIPSAVSRASYLNSGDFVPKLLNLGVKTKCKAYSEPRKIFQKPNRRGKLTGESYIGCPNKSLVLRNLVAGRWGKLTD
jgi:hypothetical protein